MAETYRPYLPEQELLLPPSLRDWLPDEHLSYFVSDLVAALDLRAIERVYEDEERGQPPYHPVMMTKVLVYAYCVGVFSSRQIQRRVAEDVAFRVLAAGNQPDFRTIADFRKQHLGALSGLFEQVLRLALELGGHRGGRVAVDGTKVKANASIHKAMSYGRMPETERRLKAEVKELLAQAEATDADEDRRHGPNRRGDELPARAPAARVAAAAHSGGEAGLAGSGPRARGGRGGLGGDGRTRGQGSVQLYRPGLAHHAPRPGWVRAGLQRAGRGGGDAATDCGPGGHAGD